MMELSQVDLVGQQISTGLTLDGGALWGSAGGATTSFSETAIGGTSFTFISVMPRSYMPQSWQLEVYGLTCRVCGVALVLVL
jgi:hypothetical protein